MHLLKPFIIFFISAFIISTAFTQSRRFPQADLLPEIKTLPDLFLFSDGSKVKTEVDWRRRHEEIKEIIRYYGYGHMPPVPAEIFAEKISSKKILNDKALDQLIRLTAGSKAAVSFNIRMIIPKGSGPFPVIVRNENDIRPDPPVLDKIIKRGYVLVKYARTELDPDENNIKGRAQSAYPDYDWATLAVWAWGASCVMNYLESLSFIDTAKTVITGHSRGGKVALLAGALDERYKAVVPNGSGCGGAASFRILGHNCETLELITKPERFAYWFHPRLREFADRVERLPYDAYFLEALVAPRALLTTDALGDLWANPLGTQASYLAAKSVYDFLGAGEKIGIHFREGKHDQTREDWLALLDFCDWQFFNKRSKRDFKQLPFPH